MDLVKEIQRLKDLESIRTVIAKYGVAADYEAARQESKRVSKSLPHLQSMLIWAASAAALEKADEARAAVEESLAVRPDLSIDGVRGIVARFARAEDHERLVGFLRKAGLPG